MAQGQAHVLIWECVLKAGERCITENGGSSEHPCAEQRDRPLGSGNAATLTNNISQES